MKWFSKNETPKVEPVTVEQPTIEAEADPNTLCRACTNGAGDGMCEYHANHGRRIMQRWEKLDKKRGS
jgi:hypothetical protein